ncbi:MAG: heavy metal sensor histidine kinase, partial [Pseudomonas sp.]
MSKPRHYSLTLRLALIFALLAFALLATLGVALYRDLERELIHRDDAALIYRVDQLRNLLNDSNTLDLIKTKPELFQNMLGNRESVLSIAAPGQKPLLEVNPGNIDMPDVAPVPRDHALEFADVQHLPGVNGVPFSTLAATIDSGDLGSLQVTTGRLMTERTAVLASYRLSVYILASIAALV